MNSGKIVGGSIIIGAVVAWALVITPDWILRGGDEAPQRYYYDAKRVFDSTETKTYAHGDPITMTYTGSCPDLSMATAKALADKKLTIREVHDLGIEARRLFNAAELTSDRNEALEAAGQKVIPSNINCPHGNDLFIQ